MLRVADEQSSKVTAPRSVHCEERPTDRGSSPRYMHPLAYSSEAVKCKSGPRNSWERRGATCSVYPEYASFLAVFPPAAADVGAFRDADDGGRGGEADARKRSSGGGRPQGKSVLLDYLPNTLIRSA